jgi:hypothetical protein
VNRPQGKTGRRATAAVCQFVKDFWFCVQIIYPGGVRRPPSIKKLRMGAAYGASVCAVLSGRPRPHGPRVELSAVAENRTRGFKTCCGRAYFIILFRLA